MRAVSIVTSHIMSLIKSGDACDDASQPATYSKREISIHFSCFSWWWWRNRREILSLSRGNFKTAFGAATRDIFVRKTFLMMNLINRRGFFVSILWLMIFYEPLNLSMLWWECFLLRYKEKEKFSNMAVSRS